MHTATWQGGAPGRLPRQGLAAAVAAFLLAIVVSLASGSQTISPDQVLAAIFNNDGSAAHSTVMTLRVPRTIAGILAGMALGLAGALMQALTRNPLADTGVLGINAGAALAMVIAIGFMAVTSQFVLVWFAFAGAGLTTLAVYTVASTGRIGATPLRLVLAGVAISSILRGLTATYVLTEPETFDRMLSWDVGTLALIGYEKILVALPFIALGTVVAMIMAPTLNVMGLGDDTAQSLGTSIGRVRTLTIGTVMLLTGSATAMIGPIGFLGLMAPQLARAICGANQRHIFILTLFIAPTILLAADIVGRLVTRPADIDVGIVAAAVGAPILIWIVRKRKVSAL
ncbi:FecCD family ABC transporter permease [Agrobacterium rosae]|uniref:Iron ABC transporter permease n=1 Tax=Agrobacterium rosae TaxID=1972867 RepID=A0AAW9FPL5_9HYPH|nr:iron ABC transporter permease [Agrobacterium rosae]MDX8304434.1 iron ABC transporter permease [Agrobacterium rosae]